MGWVRVLAVKVVRSGQNQNTLKIELIGLYMNWKKVLKERMELRMIPSGEDVE